MKGFLKNSGIYFDTKPTRGSNNAVTSDGIARAIESGGGGGGGTGDYNDLTNKPKINGTTLQGNKTLSSLGIASSEDLMALDERVTQAESDIETLETEITTASETATAASQTATQASQTATLASQTATTASQTATQADSKIGNLTDLLTASKINLVAAINELLTPTILRDETIVLNDGVTATNNLIANRVRVGSIQTGMFVLNNIVAQNVGSVSTAILGSCSFRPKLEISFIGLDYKNNATVRLSVNTDGFISLSESYGVVPGNNAIRVPYTIII